MLLPIIWLSKFILICSRLLGLGAGSTWPGHIALSLNKNFIKDVLRKNRKLSIIIIAGTNGKTTTGKIIQTILKTDGKRVFQNASGANLLNGIASTLIQHSNIAGGINADFAIFEVDENTFPLLLEELTPNYVVLLNLFRDQLDRYGEVDSIARKWSEKIKHLPKKTRLILNADDPQIAFIGNYASTEVEYFGLDDNTINLKRLQHAVDSTHCLNCGNRLSFKAIYFSHLGNWYCQNCGRKRPKLTLSQAAVYPLSGIYNRYNTLAAVLLAKFNNINNETIEQSLKKFKPAFGRQETLPIKGKRVQIFLSKNPASFNESLRTVKDLRAKHILFVLNDRIPDGRDVSWIWDVDFEDFLDSKMNIVVSGDRVYDMGLRMKYAQCQFAIEDNLQNAIRHALEQTQKTETLYILPTYSAMLEVRKILTGKKIL